MTYTMALRRFMPFLLKMYCFYAVTLHLSSAYQHEYKSRHRRDFLTAPSSTTTPSVKSEENHEIDDVIKTENDVNDVTDDVSIDVTAISTTSPKDNGVNNGTRTTVGSTGMPVDFKEVTEIFDEEPLSFRISTPSKDYSSMSEAMVPVDVQLDSSYTNEYEYNNIMYNFDPSHIVTENVLQEVMQTGRPGIILTPPVTTGGNEQDVMGSETVLPKNQCGHTRPNLSMSVLCNVCILVFVLKSY